MKQEVEPRKGLLATMAERYDLAPEVFKQTIKNTCNLGKSSDEEFLAFLAVAFEHGLNPLTREIYAFPKQGGGIQAIVSIDGWLKKMNEHPMFDGISYTDRFEGGQLKAVTACIHRKDRAHPTEITEYLQECRRNTEPWNKMPARMLRWRATAQCIRVAFNLAGIMEPDEAQAYEEQIRVSRATPVAPESDPPTAVEEPREVKVEVAPQFAGGSLAAASAQFNTPDSDRTLTVDEQDELVQAWVGNGNKPSALPAFLQQHCGTANAAEVKLSQYTALKQEMEG